MRSMLAGSLLAFGLLLALSESANAAPAHRLRARPHVIATPGQVNPGSAVSAPNGARVAVPGWSDEDTRRWLDKASESWTGA